MEFLLGDYILGDMPYSIIFMTHRALHRFLSQESQAPPTFMDGLFLAESHHQNLPKIYSSDQRHVFLVGVF